MSSPPAWSIGRGQRSTELKNSPGSNVPGPGAYTYNNFEKQRPPTWRIGTASRSTDLANIVPGPGAYNPPDKFAKEAPKYHFGIKKSTDITSSSFVPGPGAYNPNNLRSFDTKAPAYSFRVKTAPIEPGTQIPGPGAYNQASRILSQSVTNIKIGTSKRDDIYGKSDAPGPGSYTTRPASAYGNQSGPKYGFGTSKRDRDPLQEMSKTLPGPGAYSSKSYLDAHGTTMVPRRPDSAQLNANRQPGPGAYNPNLSTRASSPAYRIGTANRDGLLGNKSAPGPGQYNPKIIGGTPAFGIGTSNRKPLSIPTNTPGPGNYEIASKSIEGPKYVMSARLDNTTSKFQGPGPGQYSPSLGFVKEKQTTWKIGSASRDGLYKTKENPGPGQYDLRKGFGGPKWGFGSANRDGLNGSSIAPGPGAYNVPSNVGSVPGYVFHGTPLKIHLQMR